MAAEPDLKALERHATYRQGGPFKPAKQGEHMGSYGPLADGSYAPLADELHRSKPVPKPAGPEPGDMVMKPVKRLSERERVKAIVDKTIRSAVAKGSLSPEAGDALLAGRYSRWLDEQADKEKAAPKPPASPRPGSNGMRP